MESNSKNYNRRNTTLQKYNKDHLNTTLKKSKPIPSYKIIKCDVRLRNCKKIDLVPFMALHLSLISEKENEQHI